MSNIAPDTPRVSVVFKSNHCRKGIASRIRWRPQIRILNWLIWWVTRNK